MPILLDIIIDTFPADKDISVPLSTTITVLFDQEMDETSLDENFFLEGPDTDQYIGPGLIELDYPYNVSQGEVDDFLRSPGYQGLVKGVTTFEKVDVDDIDVIVSGQPYRTRVLFKPCQPLFPSIIYTANLFDILTLSGVSTASGHVTFSFTTGSGSIKTIPSSTSTSILNTTIMSGPLVEAGEFRVIKTVPDNHAIEINEHLSEITVEFNQSIDASSINNDSVKIFTEMATDHPNATSNAIGNVVKSIVVNGNKLIITI